VKPSRARRPALSPVAWRRWVPWIPAVSAGGFACLYVVSACLYPGGTRRDATRVGFSVIDNYWCDLVQATTYGGRRNPGQPVALAAMVVLCAGLSALWWTVPTLFRHAPWRCRIVRSAGLASAVLTPMVGTARHDLVVDAAGLFGVVAFVATMSATPSGGGRASMVLSGSTLLLALATFGVWQTGVGLGLLPLVQKAAFGAFLVWIVFTCVRVSKRAA
jgi:hypothetical protein